MPTPNKAAKAEAKPKTPPPVLPGWAEELKRRYVRGEASQFILHGNVHDLVLHGGTVMMIDEFLCKVMLEGNKDTIALSTTPRPVSASRSARRNSRASTSSCSHALARRCSRSSNARS